MAVTVLLLAVIIPLSSAHVVYHQHQDNDRHSLRSDTPSPVLGEAKSGAPDSLFFEAKPESDTSDQVFPKPNSDTSSLVFSNPNSDTPEYAWSEKKSDKQDHVFTETNSHTPEHISQEQNSDTTGSVSLKMTSNTPESIFPEPDSATPDPIFTEPKSDTPEHIFLGTHSTAPEPIFPGTNFHTPEPMFPEPNSDTPEPIFPDTADPVLPGLDPEPNSDTQGQLLHLIQGTNRDDKVSLTQETYGDIFQKCRVHKRKANCSKLGITNITDISLPAYITSLDLSDNEIRDIPNRSLAKFSKLSKLDMGGNNLQALNEESFFNLTKLKYLKLENNKLYYLKGNATFPANVFKPLVSLTKLFINNNTRHYNESFEYEYPDVALSKLQKLQSIRMDAFGNKTFGSGFSKMVSLSYFSLDGKNGYCKLLDLTRDMFTHLSHVQHLSLIKCSIHGTKVHPEVFKPFTKLRLLEVSDNVDLHIEPLGQALQMLRNSTTFDKLIMETIVNPFSPGVCVTTNFSKSLPRHLTSIKAFSNSLEFVENDVFENLPPTLTNLDLTNNRFVFGAYLKNFYKMQNLQTLVLNGGKHSYSLPSYYPSSSTSTARCSATGPTQTHLSRQKLVLSLPPRLTVVTVKNAGWFLSLTEFHFNETNSLMSLDLTGNNFPRLLGPITGLKALKYLYFENCNIYVITHTFFDDFPSLEELYLKNNYFGRFLMRQGNPPLFRYLLQLKKLNLGHTSIQNPDYTIFRNLNNLEVLELQQNGLSQFNVDISHMTNLTFVNLSDSDLTTLSNEMTRTLDHLRGKSERNLSIDLSFNPIHCNCENVHFIEWLVKSPVVPNVMLNYACVDSDETIHPVSEFDSTYSVLQRECHSNRILFITTLSLTSVIFSVIICTIIYRFRWNLTYLYYSAYIYLTRKDDTQERRSFRYDVYTSYADEDEEFVLLALSEAMNRKDIRMHIRSRDFRVGEQISSNIVDAVKNSKNTLVILTPNLLKRKWAKFEIQMSNFERVHTGHPALIFLLKDTLLMSEMGTEMLYFIKSNTYFPYPNHDQCLDQEFMNRYWSKLAHEIKSCRRDQNTIPESLVEIEVNSRTFLSNI